VAALVAIVVEPGCSNPRQVLKLYILASYMTMLLKSCLPYSINVPFHKVEPLVYDIRYLEL
jgi:hypothetical protein